MTSYQTAVERLQALGHELGRATPQKFDLAHMRVLAQALGDPQRRFPSVLIAGTNGKGSTAATLASILGAAGHRAGLYTSPHLLRVNERIRVGEEEISDAEFSAVFERVDEVANTLVARGDLPWHPSFFETLTAMAFEYFAMAAVEIAVLEVGMGGRLDATNIADPLVSVITDVSLDHQKYLGNTVAEIAGEKAGIIRPGGTVVTLPQHPEANDVIGRAIMNAGAGGVSAAQYVPPLSPGAAPLWSSARTPAGQNSEAEDSRVARNRYRLSVLGEEIEIDSPLGGRHQLRNTALAIATASELAQHGFALHARDIERGVRETHWPGRFQVVAGRPTIVFDGAHNPAGAWALRAALSERFEGRKIVLVFGAMRDKAIAEMAQILFPVADTVIATVAENSRSASPEQIREAAGANGDEVETAASVGLAVDRAKQLAGSDGVVVVAGSIYVVGEAMEFIHAAHN